MGNHELAVDLANDAMDLAPDSGLIALQHGVTLARAGETESGLRSLERAAALDESLGCRAYLVIAELALERRDRKAVVTALQRASGYVTQVPNELELAAEFAMTIGAPTAHQNRQLGSLIRRDPADGSPEGALQMRAL